MQLKQISVFVENKPGAVSAPCRVLADAGVNMCALTLADSRDFGVLRIIARDWEKAAAALKSAGFTTHLTDVIALRVENAPGGLCRLLDVLNRLELNVEYMYAATGSADAAVLIFRFDDSAAASEKIRNTPECKCISAEEFFK